MTSAGATGWTPRLRRLIGALWVNFLFSALTFVAAEAGWLRGMETAVLDAWLHLSERLRPSHVVIVSIAEEDYRELFHRSSPLDSGILLNLLKAIAAGRPSVIGVDLDTADIALRSAHDPEFSRSWPTTVWARDAVVEGSRIEPLPVLASTDSVPPSGLALLPSDDDGIVRRYQRWFRVDHGWVESFPIAVALAYCRSIPDLQCAGSQSAASHCCQLLARQIQPHDELVLNFLGDRFAFQTMRVAQVLRAATGPGWQTSGPLSTTRKVVSVEVVLQTHWKYGRRDMKVQEKVLEVEKPRSAQERPGLRASASERVRLTGRQEYKG